MASSPSALQIFAPSLVDDDEVELVDWGDNNGTDNNEAASLTTSDTLDKAGLVDPGAGCATP
jgi:hypothetical protein